MLRFRNLPFSELSQKTLAFAHPSDYNYTVVFKQMQKQTAEHWGISTRRIQILCGEGRVPGAIRIGSVWGIPEDAEKPADARIKNGKYIKKEIHNSQRIMHNCNRSKIVHSAL